MKLVKVLMLSLVVLGGNLSGRNTQDEQNQDVQNESTEIPATTQVTNNGLGYAVQSSYEFNPTTGELTRHDTVNRPDPISCFESFVGAMQRFVEEEGYSIPEELQGKYVELITNLIEFIQICGTYYQPPQAAYDADAREGIPGKYAVERVIIESLANTLVEKLEHIKEVIEQNVSTEGTTSLSGVVINSVLGALSNGVREAYSRDMFSQRFDNLSTTFDRIKELIREIQNP